VLLGGARDDTHLDTPPHTLSHRVTPRHTPSHHITPRQTRQILALRTEKAKLLGFESFAALSMASKV
jgi:Zn-dependent oligopeptidase